MGRDGQFLVHPYVSRLLGRTGRRRRRASVSVLGPRDERTLAWQVLVVVASASIVVSLNSSTLNIALPLVVRHFQAGSVAASWILLSYTLPSTVLLIVLGRVSDRVGRTEMYVLGIALFGGSNLLLGIAPGVEALIVLRIIEALASAMIMVNGVTLIVATAPRTMLTRGLGFYNASFSVAQVLGPTAGAVLVHYGGWRWIFWVNVPVGAACLVAARRVLPRGVRMPTPVRLPLASLTLMTVGLSTLVYAISAATDGGWTSPVVWGGLGLSAALLLTYGLCEARSRVPFVDWSLIRRSALASPLVGALAFTLAQFSLALLVGLYFEGVRGKDPIAAGIGLLPLPLATALAAASVGLLIRRFRPQQIAATGLCLSACGLLAAALTLSAGSAYWHVALLLVVIGCGGMFLPANTTVVFSRVSGGNLAMVNSLRLLIQNLGLVLSTALTLTVIAGSVSSELRNQVLAGTLAAVSSSGAEQLMQGYRYTLWLLCGFAGLGAIATLVWRPTSQRWARSTTESVGERAA